MPVVLPPEAGYLGKSRRRVSASGLVTWQRCPRQWHYRRRIGLNDATVPEMLIGLVVEDALCGLFMERLAPPGEPTPILSTWVNQSRVGDELEALKPLGEVAIENPDDLKGWCEGVVPSMVEEVQRILRSRWAKTPWKATGRDISEVADERIKGMLRGGIRLQLEEVSNCLGADGGPHLAAFRESGDPFSVPAPCWNEEPVQPGEGANRVAADGFREEGSVSIWEAWEIARPWVKDPRISAPQRLFHPQGWAAGELDLAHRWDGTTRIIDIKASAGTSGYSAGLAPQLRFYQWLWSITRDHVDRPDDGHTGGELAGLEGWYLVGPHRKNVALMSAAEMADNAILWKGVHEQMTNSGLHPSQLAPADPAPWVDHSPGGVAIAVDDEQRAKAKTCQRCSAAAFCDGAPESIRNEALSALTPTELTTPDDLLNWLSPKPPCTTIAAIPRRLNVKGKLTGHWGPLPNHFGEQVVGATLVVGSTSVVVEEMGADSFGEIPAGDEFALLDVAPGLWRGMTRLYLDEHTSVRDVDECETVEFTRLGLIPTRANISGLVVSRGGASGVNSIGKMWSMSTCHLWDGESVVEVVAFGAARSHTFENLAVGQRVRFLSAELGWRDGVPQVRIDPRRTRIEM